MNNRRRKTLQKVLDKLERLKSLEGKEEVLSTLKEAYKDTDNACDDEQMALDARPETLQWSTISSDMEENVNDLSDAVGTLDVLIDELGKADEYSYATIKKDVTDAINSINKAIFR